MKISMNKKYKTHDGRPVRILCVDAKPGFRPVVGLVTYSNGSDSVERWSDDGRYFCIEQKSDNDLVEISEWEDFKIDEPVMVRNFDEHGWFRRHFAGVSPENGKPLVWADGTTSFTSRDSLLRQEKLSWDQCRRPTPEELGAK